MVRKKKITNFESYFDVFGRELKREEFEKFMNINAQHLLFVYSETSARNAFDSLRVHA